MINSAGDGITYEQFFHNYALVKEAAIVVRLYKNDIPEDLDIPGDLAIDTEAMGLNNHRDRLCVVQLSNGDGNACLVQFEKGNYAAPNLKKLLSNPDTTKIFHFARFDVAIMKHYLEIDIAPIFCTKIASKLVRTYTDSHGLKELCRELLGVGMSKQQQSSNWGADELTKDQQNYAASDVLYLHRLRDKLTEMLIREGRVELAKKCCDFMPTRVELDLGGWPDVDIFHH